MLFEIKFSFFKKATKFERIFHLIWRLLSKCQVEDCSNFFCPFQNVRTLTHYKSSRAKNIVYEKVQNSFKCDICDKHFSQKCLLRKNVSSHQNCFIMYCNTITHELLHFRFFLGDCMHNIEKKITLTKKVISLKSAMKTITRNAW